MVQVDRRAFVQMAGGLAISNLAGLAAAQPAQDPGIYFDHHGLIVQRDGDGGDTAQREGWMWFGIWLRTQLLSEPPMLTPPIDLPRTLNLLEHPDRPGEFRRHPTQGGWISDPDRFSRDQLIPLVAAMGVWGDEARLRRSWNAMRPCHFILSCVQGTTDIAGPPLVNLYRRAWAEQPDESGDRVLLGGVAIRLEQTNADPEDTGDDLNLIVQLLMAKVRSPNSTTDLALQTYRTGRRICAGCYLTHYRAAYPGDFGADEQTMKARIAEGISNGWQPDAPAPLGALRWYFRAETGACSQLAELYAPMIRRWLS